MRMFFESWKHVWKYASYLFRREILHAPGHAISENREIPGSQGCGVLAEVVKVLSGTVIAQVREQFAVHDVLQYEIMRLYNHRKNKKNYAISFIFIHGTTRWSVSPLCCVVEKSQLTEDNPYSSTFTHDSREQSTFQAILKYANRNYKTLPVYVDLLERDFVRVVIQGALYAAI